MNKDLNYPADGVEIIEPPNEDVDNSVGRRISLAEASQIADQTMERAERERLELAEREAQRGIQYED